MDKYYYTYYSYEQWGRGYIGRRGCTCLPEQDVKYFGTYRDKSFKPTDKIILAVYETEAEAIAAEVALHKFYDVDINPHFANKAKQTSVGFSFSASGKDSPFYGRTFKHTPESKKAISKAHKGKTWWTNGTDEIQAFECPEGYVHGRKPISEKTRAIWRANRKGRGNSMYGRGGPGHPLYGKRWFTNGIESVFSFKCPDNFWPGRTLKKKRSRKRIIN